MGQRDNSGRSNAGGVAEVGQTLFWKKKKNESIENVEGKDNNGNVNEKNTRGKAKQFNIWIDKESAINSILSSTFAGIMSRTVTAPLDRVKYIMQITNNLPICKIFEIIKKDGIVCGFFRGNCVNIVKIIPELSIKMYSYEFMKVNVYNYYNKEGNSATEKRDHIAHRNTQASANTNVDMNIPFFMRFLIGSSSGVIAAVFIYPLEIVKTRLIVSNRNTNNGIIRCLYNIYKYEGCRNFYNGLCMHIYGVIFFSGCNMSIYDYLKYVFFSLYKDYIHSNYCIKKGHTIDSEHITPHLQKEDTKKANIAGSGVGSSVNGAVSSSGNCATFDPLKSISYFKNVGKNSSYNLSSTGSENSDSTMQGRIQHNVVTHDNAMQGRIRSGGATPDSASAGGSTCSYCSYRIKHVNCLSFLFFGITSSFIAQIVSYPFLVLRTRMQTLNNEIATNYLNNERKHIKSCSFILHNIRVYGFRSLYRGIYVNLLKTIPATSITWFAYEYSMRKLQNGVGNHIA
ncbi:transporter, putative [Plasmodium ovale]|nr:transporter, putative [Plasmodium ovale]